jgi:hypothetical protein
MVVKKSGIFFKNFVNPYADIAACKKIELDSWYIQPAGDTLNIIAHMTNPKNHPITVTVKIKGLTSPFNDSLQLTTDGYGEEMMGGSFISSDLEEEVFAVRVFTEDHYSATTQCLHKIGHFTTIGPVQAAESPTIDCNYNERYKTQYFQLVLHNKGTVATAVKRKAKISSTDPRVKKILFDTRSFPDLAAGEIETISISNYYAFNYAEGFCPDSTFKNPIQFDLTVSSDGYPFWKSAFNFSANDTTATAIEDNFDITP